MGIFIFSLYFMKGIQKKLEKEQLKVGKKLYKMQIINRIKIYTQTNGYYQQIKILVKYSINVYIQHKKVKNMMYILKKHMKH